MPPGGSEVSGGGSVRFSDGYMSDGADVFRLSGGGATGYPPSPYHSSSTAAGNRGPNPANMDDGYLSEGGASLYARKIQTRIAIEKQKAAEEQRLKLGETSNAGVNPMGVYGGSPAHRGRPLPGLVTNFTFILFPFFCE